MARSSGLGDSLYVGGYNLSGDVGSVDTISGSAETLEVTGLDKLAKERIGGLRDGAIEFTAFFNPTATKEHAVLKTLPTSDVICSYFHGSTIGNTAASMVAKQINYDPSRGDDGSLTFKTSMQANAYGLSWGEMLTAGVATAGAAGPQTSYDYGASVGTTNFGLVAYLHVFAFTGTSATVAIQSSTDNGAGDAFANITGAVFTAATGITSERIATGPTAAVERYLRVNVTGTFSLCWFAVHVTRHPVAVSY